MLKIAGSSAESVSGADGNEAVGSSGADGGIGSNWIVAPLIAMFKPGSASSASGADGNKITGGGVDGGVGRSSRLNASAKSQNFKYLKSKTLDARKNLASKTRQLTDFRFL